MNNKNDGRIAHLSTPVKTKKAHKAAMHPTLRITVMYRYRERDFPAHYYIGTYSSIIMFNIVKYLHIRLIRCSIKIHLPDYCFIPSPQSR